jgi:hypothetical protein
LRFGPTLSACRPGSYSRYNRPTHRPHTPELAPSFTDRTILLADRRDGKPLSDREGPLQVIVPGEKKHARWVRQVVRLVVGRA